MPQPLIIVGAGASYDYFQGEEMAPLTDQLVSKYNEDLLRKYDGAARLLAEIRPKVIVHKISFEIALNDICQRAGTKSRRKQQIAALQFYLQEYFDCISSGHRPMNNYAALIEKVRDNTDNGACIISLNYDSLLEQSIQGHSCTAIGDYIKYPIKIFKPHGSHNWSYVYEPNLQEIWEPSLTSYDYSNTNPDIIPSFVAKDRAIYHQIEIKKAQKLHNVASNILMFPALAIPLPGKQKFVCPVAHIDSLRNELKSCDRILIIGWRAGDPGILDLLKTELPNHNLPILIVSKTWNEAIEIGKNIEKVIPNLLFEYAGGGFSSFVGASQIDNFLSRSMLN